MKRLTLVLEISATFLRQHGNGAVAQDGTNVSFIQIFIHSDIHVHFLSSAIIKSCFADVAVVILRNMRET